MFLSELFYNMINYRESSSLFLWVASQMTACRGVFDFEIYRHIHARNAS